MYDILCDTSLSEFVTHLNDTGAASPPTPLPSSAGGRLGDGKVHPRVTDPMSLPYTGRLARFGRICFALALLGFAVASLVVGDFVAGRAPAWPAGVAGRMAWVYVSFVALSAAGVAIIRERHAVRGALVAAAMILVWALLRQLPLAAALVGAMIFTWLLVLHIPRGIGMNNRNEWTAVLEALAFSGIAFALTARRLQPRE
jgi:hypothetical protein